MRNAIVYPALYFIYDRYMILYRRAQMLGPCSNSETEVEKLPQGAMLELYAEHGGLG